MIQETLQQLNFSPKEIEIYLSILQQGKALPTDIAKMTGINRTTVYSVAKELIKKGVIGEDIAGPVSYLVAKPPRELDMLVAREEKTLQKKKTLVGQAIRELEKVAENTRYAIPKVAFIPQEDIDAYLYKRTPVWNESLLKYDMTWWGFQDDTFVEHYGKWIDWYWQDGATKSIALQLLTNDSEIEKEMEKKRYTKRKIKFWGGTEFTATTWINGDYVVMIVTSQRPHYLVEIHDATLAHNLREVFKGIWKSLE